VNAALVDTRVVLISGTRQAGKRTRGRIVAGDRLAERRDLDRPKTGRPRSPTRSASSLSGTAGDRRDPARSGAAAGHQGRRRRGFAPWPVSAHRVIAAVRLVAAPDALPGRMETIGLWPFSQGELDGEPDRPVSGTGIRNRDVHSNSVATTETGCGPDAVQVNATQRCRSRSSEAPWGHRSRLGDSTRDSGDGRRETRTVIRPLMIASPAC
jgi:hypothetical protein